MFGVGVGRERWRAYAVRVQHAPDPRISVGAGGMESRRQVLLAGGMVVLATLAAYHNSLSVPFVYDDEGTIARNPLIQNLWSLSRSLAPAQGNLTTSGRPLLSLSFALNYAWGGTQVRGYHLVNLLIHLGGGLALFGLVRRTLGLPNLRARFGAVLTPLALAVALLWAVHPLQTEAVTYVSQRAESLMGLFYLLTLYGFVRAVESPGFGRWHIVSLVSCTLGMAVKEVMVTAPVIVLLFDRTFVTGSFSAAWRARWKYYLAVGATWLLLAGLVVSAGNRGGSAGFGVGVTWWAYGLTQFEAVARYLWLSLWPHPLAFDYGTFWVTHAIEVIPYALVLVPLAAVTLLALWRRPAAGFLPGCFFAILAPTSLTPGTTQMIVEHRMYLPLAAVAVVAGVTAFTLWGRRGLIPLFLLVPALCWVTENRNRDYATVVSLWQDTVAKRPGNAAAHNNLANVLAEQPGRLADAIAHGEEALRLRPNFPEAHNNLGRALAGLPGRLPDAMAQFDQALRLKPDFAEAHNNLANLLAEQSGRVPDAIAHYEQALQFKPDYVEAHYNLALTLAELPGRLPDAIAHYEQALRLKPDFAAAHNSLGVVLLAAGRIPEARKHFEEALRLEPDSPEARENLARMQSRPAGPALQK
jgi:protein O-mannosyl-transferase